MSESEIWELISKNLSGEADENEILKLDKWIAENPKNKKSYEMMKSLWKTKSAPFEVNTDKIWNKISENAGFTQPKSNFVFSNKLLRYAAVIVFLILIPVIYLNYNTNISTTPVQIVKTINSDKPEILLLPDGSKVTLDKGSKITYPESFSEDRRIIKLKGEAFFEINHNPEKPFIVDLKNSEVKVLGTKFNIRNWKNKTTVQVTEGKVSFSNQNKQEIILTKGFQSSLNKSGIHSPVQKFDLQLATSWMKREKYFKNVSLQEIFNQLERWYDLEIKIEKNHLLNNRLDIEIKQNAVPEIFEIISLLIDCKYKVNSDKITFY